MLIVMKVMALILALVFPSTVLAQHNHGGLPAPEKARRSAVERRQLPERPLFFEGELRAVDRASGTVTIEHEPILILDMPGKSMVHAVKDAAMLEHLNPGDRVRFIAVLQGRKVLITKICAAESGACTE